MSDTGLTAQHCGSPEVEIPVIKCVRALRIRLTQTLLLFAVRAQEGLDPWRTCVQMCVCICVCVRGVSPRAVC